MPKDIFNLEHQYQLYLERVNLHEERMHPQQKVQLKEAFFGACGQLLVLFRDDIGALPEEEAIDKMQGLHDQCLQYWIDKEIWLYL